MESELFCSICWWVLRLSVCGRPLICLNYISGVCFVLLRRNSRRFREKNRWALKFSNFDENFGIRTGHRDQHWSKKTSFECSFPKVAQRALLYNDWMCCICRSIECFQQEEFSWKMITAEENIGRCLEASSSLITRDEWIASAHPKKPV